MGSKRKTMQDGRGDTIQILATLPATERWHKKKIWQHLLRASLAGLTDVDVIKLAQAGVVPETSGDWNYYKDMLHAAGGDMAVMLNAHEAGVTAQELRTMAREGNLNESTLQVMADVGKTFQEAGTASLAPVPKRTTKVSASDLRKKMNQS